MYCHDKAISAPFIMKYIVTKWYKDIWILFRETHKLCLLEIAYELMTNPIGEMVSHTSTINSLIM